MKHVIALFTAAACFVFVDDVQASIYDAMATQEEARLQMAIMEVGRDREQDPVDAISIANKLTAKGRQYAEDGVLSGKSCLRIKQDWIAAENALYDAESDTRARFDRDDHNKIIEPLAAYIAYSCMRLKGK